MALAWQNDPGRQAPRGRAAKRDRLWLARAEPDFPVPRAAVEIWQRGESSVATLLDADQPLANRPGEALAPKAAIARSRFWKAAVATSCLLHLAVAVAFIRFATDEVQIEGGEQAQVALLGNAPEDQLSAGDGPDAPDPEVTTVTLVTMLDATPVDTVDAAIVPVESAEAVEAIYVTEPLEVAETVALAPAEALQPVRPDAAMTAATVEPIRPVQPDNAPEADALAKPVKPTQPDRPLQSVTTETATSVSETKPVPQVAASPYAEILTAERLAPSEDRVAPLASETPSPTTAQLVEAAPTEPVEARQAQPIDASRQTQPVDEVARLTPVDEAVRPVPAETVATLAPVVEKPPLKKAEPKPKPVEKPEPKVTKTEKAKPKPVKAKIEVKEKPKGDKAAKAAPAKAGSRGSNQADARRGDADGAADGRSTGKSNGAARNSAAGNAAVSNYPGKIVSKLRRALRYPAAARSQGLRGEVQVAFTVSAGGGVGGIRVVRSSGSSVLDKAAVDTVRRAAPFPAIPQDAGRSSWPFTVPLAFTR